MEGKGDEDLAKADDVIDDAFNVPIKTRLLKLSCPLSRVLAFLTFDRYTKCDTVMIMRS